MAYKNILVPFDQSASAKRALIQALTLSDEMGSRITILNVVDWHDFNAETFKISSRMAGSAGGDLEVETFKAVGREAVKEAAEELEASLSSLISQRDNVEVVIVTGSPHDAIIKYANDHDFDLIVMGHRGLGAVRAMLGSVTYSVLYKTDKPVLVVK